LGLVFTLKCAHNRHKLSKSSVVCLIGWCILVSLLLFSNCFGAGHLTYMCSQLVPIVQISYFMIDCSIYRLYVLYMGLKRDSLRIFALNTGRKQDLLEIKIFVYVCSTCSLVEIKTHFETWMAWNDVNGV
jgi:hypothetical protein